MRVLFLAPYPANESPSQRYRFEHYLGSLSSHGISYDYRPFLNIDTWQIFFTPGNYGRKIAGIIKGFFRRWLLMCTIGKYDFVYIHREAAPLGPPLFEWIIAKIWRKKIIFDFDDAIWIPVASENNKIARYIKWFSKVATICRMSYKVSVGNNFLGEYARKYCKNIIVVPTVVDTANTHAQLQDQDTDTPAVGWTGTFSTLKYLDIILPVIKRLQEKHDFTFIVIANKDPKLPLKNYRFIYWSKETEIADLLQLHIGLMPLYNTELEKGKCGFKAIQYMSLGIPAVVSPVGVNPLIITDGENGFVAAEEQEWEDKIGKLLMSKDLRKQVGLKARTSIEKGYSVTISLPVFIKLFE